MQWSAYLAALPDANQAQLVNALTIGWGATRLAAQLASADRATAVILAHLDRAANQVVLARQLLTPPVDRRPAAPTPFPREDTVVGYTSWREFLLRLPAGVAAAREQAVAEAAVATQRAAGVAREDGTVETARRELDRALAALAQIFRGGADLPVQNGTAGSNHWL